MGWGKRDRLLTHSTTSSWNSRMYASTDGFEPPSSRKVPTANDSCRRRTASIVRVQFSTEAGLSRCASTLIAWYPYTGSWLIGRYSRPGVAVGEPGLRAGGHRIGLRDPPPGPGPNVFPHPHSPPVQEHSGNGPQHRHAG